MDKHNKGLAQSVTSTAIVKEGYIKRKREGGGYEERKLYLNGHVLSYSNSKNELKQFQLSANVKLSQIITSTYAGRRIYSFDLSWPASSQGVDGFDEPVSTAPLIISDDTKDNDASSSTQTGMRVAALALGGVVLGSLTAGVGLLAGLVVIGVGAAAGGSAVALEQMQEAPIKKAKILTLACDSPEDARSWVISIKTQIDDLIHQRNSTDSALAKVPSSVDVLELENWISSTKWESSCVADGFRISSLPGEDNSKFKSSALMALLSSKYVPSPCQKISIPMNASPLQVYESIREFPLACCSGVVKSLRVVEVIDRFTDVIHLTLSEIYLAPTWTASRDFCLMRFSKQNADGSFIICLDSTVHDDCPAASGDSIRGELHAAYIIAPPRNAELETDGSILYMESMLTFVAQLDPRGWIWKQFGYQEAMLKQLLLHLVDVRDFIDEDRFLHISLTNASSSTLKGGEFGVVEKILNTDSIGTVPAPTLNPTMWKEPDASTFRLRSKTYKQDNFKCNSATNLFKLVAVDVFEVPDCIQNIAMHPQNRVFQALQRDENIWVFVVNIMVPGPPFYNFVAYMTGDKTLLEEDTPFGRLAKPFFFGNDDEFRKNRFKLIPKIVEGNMAIKFAVKDTPTLLGNKIKNYYHKGENYFELDVDAGSSSVARNIIGLAIGYAKTIVIDMGFCLQGNEEDELPEVIMGCVRCINVDFSNVVKLGAE